MFLVMRNIEFSENDILTKAIEQIGSRLPPSWQSTLKTPQTGSTDLLWDAGVEFKAPTGEGVCLALEAKRSIDPRGVSQLVARGRPPKGWAPVLASPFVNPRA